MKEFWLGILKTLVAAAIVGNTVLLLDLRDRMTRMEARQSVQTQFTNTTRK